VALPEISEVRRLIVRPGDRLVLRCARQPTLAELDDIHEYMAKFAGPDVPVLVLGPGEDVEVVGPDGS
jgi:hypothetical protein